MGTIQKAVNAGVNTATGIEFQKHCAIYLLFKQFRDLKDKEYFICIEHHDDVLFCYQSNDKKITEIQAFQVKKSSDKWGLSKGFSEILGKLAQTGRSLFKDPISKDDNYFHSLQFLTNNGISLTIKDKNSKKTITTIINEANDLVKFNDLPNDIKNLLAHEIEEYLKPDLEPLMELDNISLAFIDFGKTTKSQKDQLVGNFKREINPDIADPIAAIDTLLKLFREVENSFNNGNTSNLFDISKQIGSADINKAIDIITTKQKAYNFYRANAKRLIENFNISISKQREFIQSINNSFDLFKDLSQTEHRKILSFIKKNTELFDQYLDEVDCINALYEKFLKEYNSQFLETDLKSAIIAAYVETRESIWGVK